ncbi:MAG TPA: hypothetical protein VNO69_05790 [Methyloceanibacter sp.]|nr:hypothetical protein [Methyloceanibacter sp.]
MSDAADALFGHQEQVLILAAEECPLDRFDELHKFTTSDEHIIRKLMAHGPVLLRGGRGSGKSAFLIEAYLRLRRALKGLVFPVYLSLRYLPLLRAEGSEYDRHFCKILSEKIEAELREQKVGATFVSTENISELHLNLQELASQMDMRIVLLLDDAAHIGREHPQSEFFDIFRTVSTSAVSCKASIYPGVTKFGIRFDVYNDASVIDINRDERKKDYVNCFLQVMGARYVELLSRVSKSRSIDQRLFALLFGRAVCGNMRAFIFTCNLLEEKRGVGYPEITDCFLGMASNYYWPLLEEVAPKLGMYEPLIPLTEEIGRFLFEICAERNTSYVLIHREIMQRFAKVFEILEYAGFIGKREASRAMKSGGRGAVFAVNLCNLLDATVGRRLTLDQSQTWLSTKDVAEVHSLNPRISGMQMPELTEGGDLRVLKLPVDLLAKSRAYPYGLTEDKITRLKDAGISTIGELAEAPDFKILSIEYIGRKNLKRIRDVQYQAIWM